MKSITISLTEACNLHCEWCYNQKQVLQQLPFEQFELFFEKIVNGCFENVLLIGGEPTVHPEFLKILSILKNQKVHLVTNGIQFARKGFLQECLEEGLDTLTLSIKGYTEKTFLETTQVNGFGLFQNALQNLNTIKNRITYTYTCSQNMSGKELQEFADFLNENQIEHIVITDLRPYQTLQGQFIKPEALKCLQDMYLCLRERQIDCFFRLSQPLCRYSEDFIEQLLYDKHLITQCIVKCGGGACFTPSLELIPCNSMDFAAIGKFEKDFFDYESLRIFLFSEKIRSAFKRMASCPLEKCENCRMWKICGGGCFMYWI